MPAGAGAIRAGRAFIEIGADSTALEKGLAQAKAAVQAFGASITSIGVSLGAVGGLITAPLTAAAYTFGSIGDDLYLMSLRTGISVESLSALAPAAEKAGIGLGGIEGGIRKMQRALSQAQAGSGRMIQAFAGLGLSITELKDLAPEDQMARIGDAIAGISDPAKRASAAMSIFGKSGTSLLPLFIEGLSASTAEAKAMGEVISTEDAKAGNEFNDSLTGLKYSLKIMAMTIGKAVVPTLKEATVWITKAIGVGIAWIKANQDTIATVFKVAGAVGAAGAAIAILGQVVSASAIVFSVLGGAVGFTMTLFGALQAIVGGVAVILSALSVTVSASAVAMGILSAATTVFDAVMAVAVIEVNVFQAAAWLLVGTIAAVGAIALYAGGVFEGWGGIFGDLKDTFLDTFGAIKDALSAGDFALAGQIAFSGLKVAWVEMVGFLSDKWLGFKNFFVETWDDAVLNISLALSNALGAIWPGAEERAQNLIKAANEAQAAREGERAKSHEEAQEKIDAAKAELAGLVAQAAKLKEKPAVAEKAKPVAAALPGAVATMEAVGTFSGFRLGALGVGGSIGGKIASNTERTAIAAERTADAIEDQEEDMFE